MTTTASALAFDASDLGERLDALAPEALDALDFGVIGFDAAGLVARYNAYEAAAAMFDAASVIGQHLFIELAPCLNNYLVEGRFDEARAAGSTLDEALPYVLTFRMRPTRVRMRLIARPGMALRYVLIQRGAA